MCWSGYLVKWCILWDGITKSRSDGSLVRLVTPIEGKDGLKAADARLTEFLGLVHPRLSEFIRQDEILSDWFGQVRTRIILERENRAGNQ